jgi:hypothetical protein
MLRFAGPAKRKVGPTGGAGEAGGKAALRRCRWALRRSALALRRLASPVGEGVAVEDGWGGISGRGPSAQVVGGGGGGWGL